MIIDIHGHYTTEPAALGIFRDKQLAGLADPARRPSPDSLKISDAELIASVQPQIRKQEERGGDLTIFRRARPAWRITWGRRRFPLNGRRSATI